MKFGFITNSLAWAGMKDLYNISEWALENGFTDLEVGPSIQLDEKVFNRILEKGGMDISAFIYCRNILSENPQEAQQHRDALIERIRFAPKAGIKKLICTTGVAKDSILEGNHIKYDPEASVDKVAEAFKEIIEIAENNNVRICFELCPTMSNIAISPYMWDILFEKLDSDFVGLAYDPSHLVWQFIDPYSNIKKYKNKIFHVHGKDCEIDYKSLERTGILHRISSKPKGDSKGENALSKLWWRYRLPGLGNLNWGRIVDSLYEIDYKGTISIEHEDPVWEGSLEKVKEALIRSKNHIESFI